MSVQLIEHVGGSVFKLSDGKYKCFYQRAYIQAIPFGMVFVLLKDDVILEWVAFKR